MSKLVSTLLKIAVLGLLIYYPVVFIKALISEFSKCGLDAFFQPLPNNTKFIGITTMSLAIIVLIIVVSTQKLKYYFRIKEELAAESGKRKELIDKYEGQIYIEKKNLAALIDKYEGQLHIEKRKLAALIDKYKQEALAREERNKKYQKEREENDLSNYDNQLRFVSNENIKFELHKVINREAYINAFESIEKAIAAFTARYDIKEKYRVLAEVALGSFIQINKDYDTEESRTKARKSYNSKRVDFLIIDPYGSPILAVEYNGSGHKLSADYEIRDIVKEKVLKAVKLRLYVLNYDKTDSLLKRNLAEFNLDVQEVLKANYNALMAVNKLTVNKRPANSYTPAN